MRPATVEPSTLLQEGLATYREHFAVLFPLALIVGLIQAILTLALANGDSQRIGSGELIASVAALLPALVYLAFTIELVRDAQGGGAVRPTGALFGAVLPLLPALLAVALLSALGIVAGLVLLIVPGLVLATIWAVALPAYVVERHGVVASLGRSRALVRGHGWPVFGVLLLVVLIALVAALVGVILSVDPTSAIGGFVQLVVTSLVTPITTLVLAGLYFRLVELADAAPPADRNPAREMIDAPR